MIVGMVVGWTLVFGAAATFAIYRTAAVGEIWAGIHTNSLVGIGAIVEKSISPELWSEVLVPLLSQPAWLVLGAPGIVLAVLFRWLGRRARG